MTMWSGIRNAMHTHRDAPKVTTGSWAEGAPASIVQERLFPLVRDSPHANAAFNLYGASWLEGKLDRRALRKAVDDVAARHDALRTLFVDGSPPWQDIRPAGGGALVTVDLRDLPPARGVTTATAMATREAARPFSLTGEPLLRVVLYAVAADRHLLLVVTHHLVSDGHSMKLFFRDLFAGYASAVDMASVAPLSPVCAQYADFVAWQQRWFAGGGASRAGDYWARELSACPDGVAPPGAGDDASALFEGGALDVRLEADLSRAVRDHPNGYGAGSVLLTALYLLIHELTGADDLVVGVPMANRLRGEFADTVGYFVNTHLVRCRPLKAANPRELLATVARTLSQGFAHQQLPLSTVLDTLGRPVLCPVNFVYQNNVVRPLELPGVRTSPPRPFHNATSKKELTVTVRPDAAGRLRIRFEYMTRIYRLSDVQAFSARYVDLVQGIVEGGDRCPAP